MNYYANTDIGRVRSKNQDQATVIVNTKDQIVAVVCDGMGGHRSGEIASRVVIEHVTSCFIVYRLLIMIQRLKSGYKIQLKKLMLL